MPARPNLIGVREGDKLKVVRFPRSFELISTPSPKRVHFGWHQKRCSLDSHCVTNHALAVREGDKTQSRAKSPHSPQTSTLSFFHTPHKILVKDTDEILERHTTWSSFTSCSGRYRHSTRRHDSTIFQLFFPLSHSDLSHRINHHCGGLSLKRVISSEMA